MYTLRRYLCRLVIIEWVRVGRYPVESVWLDLLNHLDGIDPRSHPIGLLTPTNQLVVEFREEPQHPPVLEIQLLGEIVGEVKSFA